MPLHKKSNQTIVFLIHSWFLKALGSKNIFSILLFKFKIFFVVVVDLPQGDGTAEDHLGDLTILLS